MVVLALMQFDNYFLELALLAIGLHLFSILIKFAFASVLYQKLDEAAVQIVFLKSLENYIKWCNYLVLQPVWSKYEVQFFDILVRD